jgi:hypothetical protein
VIAATVTSWLAVAAVAGYVIDALGFGVQPWASALTASLLIGGSALAPRQTDRAYSDVIAWVGIVGFIAAMLLRLAGPGFVPPGRGPDLTHHLLLVDYIESNGHLVHDGSLDGSMGEMAHYTPASHLLAVMGGRWFGSNGLHAFYPLSVICCALTAGFVFLIGRRHRLSLPAALAAPILLLLPAQYFLGAFTHDGFLSQTVSIMFAVAAWWEITVWDEQPTLLGAAAAGLFLIAIFLSWPIWLGPPLLVFAALAFKKPGHLAVAVVPFLAMAAYYAMGQWRWMVIVRTSGAVLHPSVDSLGWLLPLLAIIGAALSVTDRRVRVTLAVTLVIALQTITLFAIATSQGASTPYMSFKMFYFAIYPMAIFAAIALSRAARQSESIGWLVAAILVVVCARPALLAPRAIPVVDEDLYRAGQWMRAHVGSCADYLVADPETAYWLHLAVLGNSRSGERMKEIDLYEPRAAVAPWITAEGRGYAIADLRLLPDEVRSRVDIAAQFGHAAVIKSRGVTMKGCD